MDCKLTGTHPTRRCYSAIISGVLAAPKGEAASGRQDSLNAIPLYCSVLLTCYRAGYRGLPYIGALAALAKCYNDVDDPENSLPVVDTAIDALAELEYSEEVLLVWFNCEHLRGIALMRLARTTEAIASLELALSYAERGGSVMNVIRSLIDLVNALFSTGDFDKCMRFLQRAEALCVRDNMNETDYADYHRIILTRRGKSLDGLHRYSEALECLSTVLALEKTIFGPLSSQVGDTLQLMASVYGNQRDLIAAFEANAAAIHIYECCGEINTLSHSTSLTFSSFLLISSGRAEQAGLPLERCLAIERKLLPPKHPMLAYSLALLADVYIKLGRTAEAAQLMTESTMLLRRVPPAAPRRRAPRRVRQVPVHLLLRQGVPDRGLEA